MATTTLTPQAEAYQRSWVLDWLTTVDHKKIGILYIVNSFIFFFAAGILALVSLQARRAGPAVPGSGDLQPAFTMHGTIMIFLFVVPVCSASRTTWCRSKIGAPDMAFPRINALSFWLLPLGGGLIFAGFLFGGAAARGLDQLRAAEQRDLLAGRRHRPLAPRPDAGGHRRSWARVNFVTTIFKMRAPGMTLFRMPIFAWTCW